MHKSIIKRLPEVKNLFDILPSGAEGGKEFARILDLLLFHEARRQGKKFTLFSDVSGDYNGLDSYEGDAFRKSGSLGYQYKFFSTPLSAAHRHEVLTVLQKVAKNQKTLKISRLIFIFPQDLVESSTRTDGGDVTWFESLRNKLKINFEIEAFGHKKIIGLFLENPLLCLFYYPELVIEGSTKRHTIQHTRQSYDENLLKRYSKIEFVGMSVYKPEATKGVSMEHIYIPLSAVPEKSNDLDDRIPRTDPLTFLSPGSHHVILGDPGSGKSTLLKFLALGGICKPLQDRYRATPDKRLPILIVLRSYADELKSKLNLSLLDYICETVQAEFCLPSADREFFQYYLESGQTILFFDGLDELPNPQYKKTIIDRIHSLCTSYPGNTVIVSSRIVGYGNPGRFDEKTFLHYRLTKLRLPEIAQFVLDWYNVRIENEHDRNANVKDLIRILSDESHVAIRELAENPLLLTIVALVHRIDAVLPDERVVLYQKCTETLLNTWHTWKLRDSQERIKGKIERRNRRRIEAIAYWMHSQGGGSSRSQRAMVSSAELTAFLTNHILRQERINDNDNDPEDLAIDFLEFVKKRAGLLLEVGSDKYSFVHLTFQEYLTSTYIITHSETHGVEAAWDIIKDKCTDPRWHEVIRLLVAGLKSDESQELLIEHIVTLKDANSDTSLAVLLGGFVLDSIECAESKHEQISKFLVQSSVGSRDAEQLRILLLFARSIHSKYSDLKQEPTCIIRSLNDSAANEDIMSLRLIHLALSGDGKQTLTSLSDRLTSEQKECIQFLFNHDIELIPSVGLIDKLNKLAKIQEFLTQDSASGNLISAMTFSIYGNLPLAFSTERLFWMMLKQFSYTRHAMGPFSYYCYHLSLLYNISGKFAPTWSSSRSIPIRLVPGNHLDTDLLVRLENCLIHREKSMTRKQGRLLYNDEMKTIWGQTKSAHGYQELFVSGSHEASKYWQYLTSSPEIYRPLLDMICYAFQLRPEIHWVEALRVSSLSEWQHRSKIFTEESIKKVEEALENSNANVGQIYLAASLLIFDVWLYYGGHHKSLIDSPAKRIADLVDNHNSFPVKISSCLRKMAYGDTSLSAQFDNILMSKWID